MTPSSRWLPGILMAVSLAFAAFTVWYVWVGRLVVPAYDQWMFLYWFKQALAHGLDIPALIEPHNGHYLPIPRLIFFARNTLGQGDPRLLVAANIALQAASICLVASALWREPALQGRAMRSVLAAVAIILLSWTVQFENFYWGLQIIFVLTTFLVVSALRLYLAGLAADSARSRLRFTVAALTLGCMACATFSAGLAIWPALLVMAVARRAGRAHYAAITAAGALTLGLYLAGPVAGGSLREALSSPGEILAFVARYLGPPVVSDEVRTYLGGGMLLGGLGVLAAAARGPRLTPLAAFHAGLIGFGLAVAVMTALARVSGGVGGGGTSRYAAYSMLYWVGLISFVGAALVQGGFRLIGKGYVQTCLGAFYGVCLTAFAVLVLPSQSILPRPFIQSSHQSTAAALSVITGVPDRTAIQRFLYPNVDFAVELSRFLMERRYGLFGSRFAGSLGRPAAETYGGSSGTCPAAWQTATVAGGLRLTGRFETSNDRPERLVVLDDQGIVVGLGVAQRLSTDFIAYARGLPSRLYGVTPEGLCLAARLRAPPPAPILDGEVSH